MLKEISKFGKALSRAEQKNVFGGNAPGTCSAHFPCSASEHGTCSGGENNYLLNVSKSDAQAFANANGGRWCCDSCSTATWMQPSYMYNDFE